MALAFAAHVAPPGWERVVGVAAVVTLSAVSYRGITRTARLTMVVVTPVLAVRLAGRLVVTRGRNPRGGTGGPGARGRDTRGALPMDGGSTAF